MIIAANWKAYVEDADKAKKLVALAKRLAAKTKVELVLAPPAPFLGLIASGNRSKVSFAAQDVSVTLGGAYTGEATAQMYAALGARYALVGHSERRAAGDTNATVAEKLAHAVAQGLTPILCVGERERDPAADYLQFIREELVSALSQLSQKERLNTVIAYEPIWAIGKSATDAADSAEIQEMTLFIRKVLAEIMPGKAASRASILYGGSVEPANIRDIAGGTGVDGFLVGHASVAPDTFSALITALA
ncbi:MAG: triose-phosphate isomerase [Patescibacteria group bacterium]|nr:triose-phosphate isomerase [Patescibacteria group bacterium]